MTSAPKAATVGIDVGGTFTDFVFVGPDGGVTVSKQPTTPHDASVAVLAGIDSALEAGLLADRFEVSHGTTIATNALLERRGAETALITTRGFRDVLEIGRQARRRIYSLNPDRAAPLLPRDRRFEVTERIDWQGAVIAPLDEAELDRVLKKIAAAGIDSLAICFLFAHLNDSHERRAAEMARAYGLEVSLSSEVAPEPREFERTATVVANAMVAPILRRYLGRLDESLARRGAAMLRIMQSNGGALPPHVAGEHAVKTALSGPAGGVIAAARIASDACISRLITFDMGGTSTDVSLVLEGRRQTVTLSTLGDIPLRTPMLDIHTVGAGGGSQAWTDSAGGLRVGPRSAGAVPGPVAYGTGEELTVTDANIFLGRLPADARLAGSVPLDADRVRRRFEQLASSFDRPPESIAQSIITIAETSMVRALRHISIERGHDPSQFVLLSFGGAGGLHACALAEALGIREALIPRFPGALSALGLAIAPFRQESARAFPAKSLTADNEGWNEILGLAERLRLDAEQSNDAIRHADAGAVIEVFLDVRYVGQSYEILVPLDPDRPTEAIGAFHAMHRLRYGHADPESPIEGTAVRVIVERSAPFPTLRFPSADMPGKPVGQERIHGTAGWILADRYLRDELARDQLIQSPALILQSDAATYIPTGWSCTVDVHSNLRLVNGLS